MKEEGIGKKCHHHFVLVKSELTGSSGNDVDEGHRPQRTEKQEEHSGQWLMDPGEEGKRSSPRDLVRATTNRMSHRHHHGSLQICGDMKHLMGRRVILLVTPKACTNLVQKDPGKPCLNKFMSRLTLVRLIQACSVGNESPFSFPSFSL